MLYIISPTWPMLRVIEPSFMGLRSTRNLRKVCRAGVLARRFWSACGRQNQGRSCLTALALSKS